MANLSSFWMHSNTIRIHDIDTTQNRKIFNALNLSRAKIFMQYLGIIASMVRYAIRNMRFHIVCCAMHKAIAKHICHWWCVISTRIHIMKSLKRKKKKKGAAKRVWRWESDMRRHNSAKDAITYAQVYKNKYYFPLRLNQLVLNSFCVTKEFSNSLKFNASASSIPALIIDAFLHKQDERFHMKTTLEGDLFSTHLNGRKFLFILNSCMSKELHSSFPIIL